jgi:VanZ family protein
MWLLITLIYMSGILYSSLQSGGSGDPHWLQAVKESLHVPAYAGLAYLWIRTLKVTSCGRWTVDCRPVAAFVIAVVYGIFNEYVQSFVPGRDCSFTDVWHNALGAGIVALFVTIPPPRRWRR